MASNNENSALADGLFWAAEKLRFGYEDEAPDPIEALKLYKTVAASGHGRANLRLAEMYEQGIGAKQDLKLAVVNYKKALHRQLPEGLAGLGGLLLRSGHISEGQKYWRRYFDLLAAANKPTDWPDDRVVYMHRYFLLCFAHKVEPTLHQIVFEYKDLLMQYHQLSLEKASSDMRLDQLSRMTSWIASHLI